MVEPACRRRSGQVDSWFSKKRSTLGAALVLTSPGIPMLFQGQELLEDRWFQDKDPIDWSRTEDEHGILGMYRDLIVLRRNRSGVTRGLCGQNIHIYHFDDGAKLIAFHRWDKQGPTDSVVVVVNMMNQNRDGYVIGFPRAGLWKTRFNSNTVHLMILIDLSMSTGGRGVAWRGRSGKLLILRLTPRGLRRLRLETTRSWRISSSTLS